MEYASIVNTMDKRTSAISIDVFFILILDLCMLYHLFTKSYGKKDFKPFLHRFMVNTNIRFVDRKKRNHEA